MFNKLTILLLVFFCFPLYAQHGIVKFEFSDSYETDPSYMKFKSSESSLIKEINALRDSIIYTKDIPEEDKLHSLQLVNMLYEEPDEVSTLMRQNGDWFPWYQVMSKEKVESLVDNFSSFFYYSSMIRSSYEGLESNEWYKYMDEVPDGFKKKVKFLGLHKDKDIGTIFLRNVFSNTGVDRFFRNKDIYFTCFSVSEFKRREWCQQYYAHKKLQKRGNVYAALCYDDIGKQEEYFDYIIENLQVGSLYSSQKELNMLKPGGRMYVEIDFLTEKEHAEHSAFLEKRYAEMGSDRKIYPHFTRESMDQFLLENSLEIEKEKEEGEKVIYILRKR